MEIAFPPAKRPCSPFLLAFAFWCNKLG